MPEKIQRVPRGLIETLSISGGLATRELLEQVRGTLDHLQFYGLQQQRVLSTTNAALAELGSVDVTNVTAGCQYALLFGASFTMVQTATATALRGSVHMLRSGSAGLPVAHGGVELFGAPATGTVKVPFFCPYPLLLTPPWTVRGFLDMLGTDANASCTITAEIGVLN